MQKESHDYDEKNLTNTSSLIQRSSPYISRLLNGVPDKVLIGFWHKLKFPRGPKAGPVVKADPD